MVFDRHEVYCSPVVWTLRGATLSEEGDIRQRIEVRIGQGEFLQGLLRTAAKESSGAQETFVRELSRIALAVRSLLADNALIHRLEYRPGTYWKGIAGQTFAFIDGGVANIDLPSAAPVGIRIGSYVVRPGDTTDARERFRVELSLVDDLYSDDGVLYDNDFEDLAKLRDAARIAGETASAYHLAIDQEGPKLDAIILHGPLVNPVSPYGLDDFPCFGSKAARVLLHDGDWNGNESERQFVNMYRTLLERLGATGIPVAGAVERSLGRHPVVLGRILDALHERKAVSAADAKELEKQARTFGLNDATLLDVVLEAGEYVAPLPVNRQGLENKWPDRWKREIRAYPAALTTYLKPSDLVTPFRVETFEGTSGFEAVLDLILHTSRLLPSYGFPVGLDIVDKFAKVPAWMSRGVRGQHQVVLLRKAMESGDPNAIAFAKRVLTAKGRDWLFRPQA